MKRLSSIILLAVSLFIVTAEAYKPSMDGRAVVADYGELPVGFFAKSASYLPGDTVIVTNPSTRISVEVMIFGSFDSSEGIAIILSPEAARELYITKGSNSIVQVTKKNSVYSESSILSRTLGNGDIDSDPDVNPDLLIGEPIFDTPAIVEELPVFDPPMPSTQVASTGTTPEPVLPVVEEPVIIEPEPVIEPEPLIEPEPIVIIEPVVEPEPKQEQPDEVKPVYEPEPEEPVEETKTVEEPEPKDNYVDEPEPVAEPKTIEESEIKLAYEPEPVENNKPDDDMKQEPVAEPEPEPEPVVEPEPEPIPEPVVAEYKAETPAGMTNDSIFEAEENKVASVPTIENTGLLNDSINDNKIEEEPVVELAPEPEPVVAVEPEPEVEIIENEFIVVPIEPVVATVEPVVNPEETTAVLIPTKPNPPEPAVSDITTPEPQIKPERQEPLSTSDSIYEGTDRTMERYSYPDSVLSSSINDGSDNVATTEPNKESVTESVETTEEPDKNVYFEDEPEVFIIPILEPLGQPKLAENEEPEYDPYSDIPASEAVASAPESKPEPEPEPVVVVQPVVNVAVNVEPEPKTEPKTEPVSVQTVKASNLDKGCYIQIATYSKMSNVNDVCGKYSERYPMKVVETSSGGWQVLVGNLSESEYTIVLERFKSYGYKDAFLKRVN